MSDDPVLLEQRNGIATITINQPDRRNALSIAVSNGIMDALDEIEGGETRCVVLAGAGPAFCAGGDVKMMIERFADEMSLDAGVRHVIQQTGRAIQRVAECEFPTVAKVDGAAFGAGANLAIACDIVLFSDDAKISFGFRQVGLAVDSGTSYLLPRLVGDNIARELVFTGELLDADRAKEIGLVNHVYDTDAFEANATELTETIATGPTVALRTSKRLLRHNPNTSLDAAIEQEAAAQAAVLDSRDHAEGAAAFAERREPEFSGE
ncbi:enoyl-CoA hydratase/isomerase family protein [Natronocalculus amylovorans]|uniref:Enoyl-CoA hydratase-related protein n=1 Tax=Natronocalculus amylovorans TaxID=2917812 RepID=A0AAE3K8P1_9EURY|nr:enoyl-CoA hydratase-related protein [Natronocalculus amylovorans]MCL9817243.1 enoyl-CoA hydratase-related protein [Natronocalculus amylovorans]NUE02728.1 enoyl-CoA hydratase/isomerase family protein [Halorubraceae archaeon YAN]